MDPFHPSGKVPCETVLSPFGRICLELFSKHRRVANHEEIVVLASRVARSPKARGAASVHCWTKDGELAWNLKFDESLGAKCLLIGSIPPPGNLWRM